MQSGLTIIAVISVDNFQTPAFRLLAMSASQFLGHGVLDCSRPDARRRPVAARTPGKDAYGTLRAVHLPLINGFLVTALILMFVDRVKERPATPLLRPFNFNTLATRVYESASLENIIGAAPTAMLTMIVGSVGGVLLICANR